MLACYSPSQELPPSQYFNFSFLPPQPSDRAASSSPHSSLPELDYDEWMPSHQNNYQNPAIRLQQSSPFSVADQRAQQQMLVQSYPSENWGSGDSLLNPANFVPGNLSQQKLSSGKQHHKRVSSASSVASAGPPSPQDSTTVYPRIASGDNSHFPPSTFDSLDIFATNRGLTMPKSLPTPVATPTQNTFNLQDYQQYSSPQDTSAMRRIHHNRSPNNDDDGTGYTYSGPQSVSSVSHHDSPATPQTASYDGDFGEAAKGLQQQGFNSQMNSMPHGIVTNNFDDFYNTQLQNLPQQQQSQQQQQQQQQMLARAGCLSPFRTSLANRFQAAQLEHVSSRSASPAHSIHREKSPFRQGPQFDQPAQVTQMANQSFRPPQMMPVQYQQQQAVSSSAMMAQPRPQQQPQQPEQPKTVSPKDVELEYHEESQTPLFPSSQQSQFSLPREESNFSNASNFGQQTQYYNSMPSSAPQGQQYPFLGQQRRQPSSFRSNADQSLPEFPAHLASMETTVSSESGQDIQSPVQAQRPAPIARPRDTSAEVGTYSCTFQGCTQRFPSPGRLQKHRRDFHRQASPTSSSSIASTTPIPSHSTASASHVSSASTIASRNAQTGPHRCDRINPTTGKPCNSVFSRPYDLTRHEDTIHSGRKQKVRCHLCTEEKTFSRNDALTRHMRVVHPEVDWPGKSRRKGRD